MNLVRDKETGKSKGFAFLKYEDQRSTDLAVDNLGGTTVMGRVLKVDHTRYKPKDDEEEKERERAFNEQVVGSNGARNGHESSAEENERTQRPMLKEEKELAALINSHDEEDPMKEFLIGEKKEEVAKALARLDKKIRKSGERKKHHHRHKHRSPRRSDSSDAEGYRRRHQSHSHRRRSRSP